MYHGILDTDIDSRLNTADNDVKDIMNSRLERFVRIISLATHLNDNESLEVTKTLDYWKKQLGDANFYQINRSHIVNLGYVTSVNKNKVILKCNGEIIELKASSRIYASLKRAYYSFLGGTSK